VAHCDKDKAPAGLFATCSPELWLPPCCAAGGLLNTPQHTQAHCPHLPDVCLQAEKLPQPCAPVLEGVASTVPQASYYAALPRRGCRSPGLQDQSEGFGSSGRQHQQPKHAGLLASSICGQQQVDPEHDQRRQKAELPLPRCPDVLLPTLCGNFPIWDGPIQLQIAPASPGRFHPTQHCAAPAGVVRSII